jgi:isoleucyl-tRNA synthetase
MSAFSPVDPNRPFPDAEIEIIARWAEQNTFQRSIDERSEDKPYVFYDGPPFATGLPHYGHLVASTLKDIVPRYWTMRGYRVERRFGWDTHGLPIEMLIEKQLGLSGPTSIKEYGVAKFNEACRAGVLKYTEEWRKVVTRLGRWVDFDNDYKTMDAPFMESLWWVFKQLWDKGLVYRDFRVMPFSWRLSTSLSNFEANMDYRDVQDPAITVTMPVLDHPALPPTLKDAHLLVWTTTPWTLPSNLAVAVGTDIEYVRAKKAGDDRAFILAKALVEPILGKDAEILAELTGADLVGARYAPLFDYFQGHPNAFQVIAAGHVTTASGTGLVHMAPDYGEDDFVACKAVDIRVVESVDDEGNFKPVITDWAGRNIKEADPDIIKALKAKGRLLRHDTIDHPYPFCWRSGTPLIYKAVPAWFVKVEAIRDRMVAHNETIHWVPEAVGGKRFANWLAEARDWNVSRNRFWGTPLPIWECQDCDHRMCLGSIDALQAASDAVVDDLHPHKIDHLEVACEACGGAAKRVPDVFDCWFESGSMPYAQRHHPFENADSFDAQFPAQFIAEGLDQTRGWFYTLLVLSTALYDKAPFKNVIVNGMVLAEDGAKMSKSKQNYPAVDGVFAQYGADALRAYLINSPIVRAEPLKFSERGVKEVVRTVLLPLRNAWSFFNQYANIDGWHPVTSPRPPVDARSEMDQWILSVLQSLVAEVNTQMEGYYLYKVVPPVLGFIDDLTNWYIRCNRRRFWRSSDATSAKDKASAYATLHEVLVTFSKVLAPVLPFISEAIYQNLVVEPRRESRRADDEVLAGQHRRRDEQGEEQRRPEGAVSEHRDFEGEDWDAPDSVHLCDYPQADTALIKPKLETAIGMARTVVGLGRVLREQHRIKTRQPLGQILIVHHDENIHEAIAKQLPLICEELNVKYGEVTNDDADLATLTFKANFKRLGRRLGKRMREAAQAIAAFTRVEWEALQKGESITVADEPITAEDVIVTREPKGDVVIATDGPLTVALDVELDDELRQEGLAREVTSKVQRLRKDLDLAITDRIRLTWHTEDAELLAALNAHGGYIAQETLAGPFTYRPTSAPHPVDIDGRTLQVYLEKA